VVDAEDAAPAQTAAALAAARALGLDVVGRAGTEADGVGVAPVDEPTMATQSPVFSATSANAARLSATKPGFKRRSSGG